MPPVDNCITALQMTGLDQTEKDAPRDAPLRAADLRHRQVESMFGSTLPHSARRSHLARRRFLLGSVPNMSSISSSPSKTERALSIPTSNPCNSELRRGSRTSPVHAASLVDPANHSSDLVELIDIKLFGPVIGYVVACIAETVDLALGRVPLPCGTPSSIRCRRTSTSNFTSFVADVLSRAEVATATVLTTLVYIRVFLGALIVASKYTNDSTLKNVHWASCTGIFGKNDIGRIEREFLDVLNWELGVVEADLLIHRDGLMAVASPPSASKVEITSPNPHRRENNNADSLVVCASSTPFRPSHKLAPTVVNVTDAIDTPAPKK
ncbi:hypothetical protein C8R43DRAFT_1140702 [Mycena crocata]|nr:hypothetical protein C8R43DRAFT_1140702 [Mycena crocata]